MTSNLVGGFIQRSDEVRRYAFGQMYVLNNAAPYEVTGMWMMRGQDIKPMLDSNPDAEYYTWTKMDPKNEEHKKLVEAYWAEPAPEEHLLGKVVYDSRVFK
jgi:elongation factor 1-gamma